jgi:hypothetical protein
MSELEAQHLEWMKSQGFSTRINFEGVERIIPPDSLRKREDLYRELHVERGLALAWGGENSSCRGIKLPQFNIWDDPEMGEADRSYLKELGFYHLIGQYTYYLHGLIPKYRS